MIPAAESALRDLLEGNQRFCDGWPRGYHYWLDARRALVARQAPIAAIVACSDSRVAPEVILDQPLGSLMIARVPGNVATPSVYWMIDLAIGELNVPLILVIGHTGCRAVQKVLDGEPSPQFDALLRGTEAALARAQQRANDPADLYREVVMENAIETVEELKAGSPALHDALAHGTTEILPALFDIESGKVIVLPARTLAGGQ